jgi:SRSO17 transposase
MMTLKELKSVGRTLTLFLLLFKSCFRNVAGRKLLRVYVSGLLSDLQRKNCESMALQFDTCPRTLQRFLESIKWDEEMLRDQCQEIVVREHAHAEAIGLIDESGISKSGHDTAGVGHQYNGNRGKIENCVVGVHLGYSAPGFMTILDSRLYLPQDWADDAERRKKSHIPDEVTFQTKPQIAITLIDRALSNGLCVAYWTFDELYGRDSKFLDALQDRKQSFVGEIPRNTRVWTTKPDVIRDEDHEGVGGPKTMPRVAVGWTPSKVENLLKHSSKFYLQSWQKYVIKNTDKGPEVWKIKHLTVWRQSADHLPGIRHTLIVARSVRTGETKYFIATGVVGEDGVTLRGLLRVAFGRWAIEAEFRISKEDLGLDHFEVRGWRCIHRHYHLTGLSFLLCSRIRQSLDKSSTGKLNDIEKLNDTGRLTVEQVRRSISAWLQSRSLPEEILQRELNKQAYHQRRNAQAIKSHTKSRIKLYASLGIDVQKIKSCVQSI